MDVKHLLKSFFFSKKFFFAIAFIILLFILGYIFSAVFSVGKIVLLVFLFLCIIDFVLIFPAKEGIEADRKMADMLSNGDDNQITLTVRNNYNFKVKCKLIDELPVQLQIRNFSQHFDLPSQNKTDITFTIHPVKRGEYLFGQIHVFIRSRLGFLIKRYSFNEETVALVYPSILQMKKYEIFATTNRLNEIGIKKIRRIGMSLEFDQISKYTVGDDYRKINWKATARKQDIMVNRYRDQRSQPIYNVIDMGRAMKMPFNGMSLLDYAVNTCLILSNVALRKDDRVGLLTFSKNIESLLPADRRYSHILKILEILYNCNTDFLEPDFEKLYYTIEKKFNRRSLIVLYTNFETLSSLNRNLKYLRMITRKHSLLIIFFENTELNNFLQKKPETVEDIYIQTISEKFSYEKKRIRKELERNGIHTIYTTPDSLTISTINKYIELKARGII